MEKLSITLPHLMAEHVSAEVAAGRYASTSEYMRSALTLKMAEDAEVDLIKQRYTRIETQAAAGQLRPMEDVLDQMSARVSGK